MGKLMIPTILFMVLLSTASFAQENFLHVTMDIESGAVGVDTNLVVKPNFTVSDYVQQIGDEGIFTFSYNSENILADFKIKIALPQESIVIEKQGALLLSRPVQISTDGTKIFLEWSAALDENDQFTSFVQYRKNVPQTNYFIITALILAIVAFVAGYSFKIFKKEKFVKAILSDDEKKVADIAKKGETTQDEIKKKLNWSKTKTSKIIRNLEVKNVVAKIPYKKTNKIKLK